MAYNISDRLGIALACLAGVMAIILFLIEKTPTTILCLLSLMVTLLVYPVLHFVKNIRWRTVVFILCGLATLLFGWSVWPHKYLIADASKTDGGKALPDTTIVTSSSPFYDFQISKVALMASIKVDTKYALQYKDDLNFIIILRAVDDSVDALDDARLMKSEPFAITGEERTIQINLTKEFFERTEAASRTLSKGNMQLYVALVPKSVRPNQIVTIRDITRLGGKQVQIDHGLAENANPY
jgi:hypothetical protein